MTAIITNIVRFLTKALPIENIILSSGLPFLPEPRNTELIPIHAQTRRRHKPPIPHRTNPKRSKKENRANAARFSSYLGSARFSYRQLILHLFDQSAVFHEAKFRPETFFSTGKTIRQPNSNLLWPIKPISKSRTNDPTSFLISRRTE